MKRIFALLALIPLVALSQEGPETNQASVTFMWEASTTPEVTYKLYASTNELTYANRLESAVQVNVGTNQQVTLSDFSTIGKWYVGVTAKRGPFESVLSNVLLLEAPAPATSLRMLVLESTISLSSGWTNVGFFRLKIGN